MKPGDIIYLSDKLKYCLPGYYMVIATFAGIVILNKNWWKNSQRFGGSTRFNITEKKHIGKFYIVN